MGSNYFLDAGKLFGIIETIIMKRPPTIVVQLIHIFGPLKGQIQEFTEPIISIGRHPDSHLCFPVDLTNVSRKHAEIVREGNQFKLIDHSANGTFVNGKKVKDAYLKNGDVLAFSEGGPKVSFLTQMKEIEAEPERMPLPPSREESKEPFHAEPPKVGPKRTLEEKPPEVQIVKEKSAEVSVQPVKAPLVIQYGPTLRSYKELPIILGKSSKCDFIIDHPALFDQHAQIFFSQNQYWIKDLTGQGVVQVNRTPISFQSPLKLNDDVSLSPRGPIFRFLGEGRLAEIEEPSKEEPSKPSEKKGETQQEIQKGKGWKSVFKKLLER
jgi:pSer/pThr/pTyr-binding forkhead associated (FHA) protein